MQEIKRIKAKNAKVGMVLADSIYKVVGDGRMMIARHDTEIDEKTLENFDRHEISWVSVYVQREPGTGTLLLGSSVEKKVEKPAPVTKFGTTPGKIRSSVKVDLKTEAIEAIRLLFAALQTPGEDVNRTNTYKVIHKFENVLNRLVAEVATGISKYIHIQDLKVVEDFPYFHSLSVAMLSVATGKVLGLDVLHQRRLAKAAILHDIGKPLVSQNITGKKGKLTTDEISEMQEHTKIGAESLKRKGFGDSELWNAVLLHHEKVDGTGYPRGISGDEIPLFSKIIAVADTYDAVTSIRPHREPMTPADALELISSEVGKSFDYDVVMAFTKKLQLYPVGTAVELNDSRLAVVKNSDNILRPIVEMMDTGEELNLAENLSLSITKVVTIPQVRKVVS
ncbi:MAG: HD-GYP domain-containing protein [Defluviitaleaceae bacterium]|nr:HD-GYP domain-containing protein [Defluviitaleaceae bacterium]